MQEGKHTAPRASIDRSIDGDRHAPQDGNAARLSSVSPVGREWMDDGVRMGGFPRSKGGGKGLLGYRCLGSIPASCVFFFDDQSMTHTMTRPKHDDEAAAINRPSHTRIDPQPTTPCLLLVLVLSGARAQPKAIQRCAQGIAPNGHRIAHPRRRAPNGRVSTSSSLDPPGADVARTQQRRGQWPCPGSRSTCRTALGRGGRVWIGRSIDRSGSSARPPQRQCSRQATAI